MKLSIIIPTFNEERTIERLIRRLLAVPFPIDYELVIVDDHSGDRTFAIEQRLHRLVDRVRMAVIRHPANRGKGACIREGLKHATGELVIVQDGDLEYKPREIPRLLTPLLEGRAEVVYGSRFLSRRWPAGMALPNYVANQLLRWLVNGLYGVRLTDPMTCYKVMPRRLLQRLDLRARRFECETEITAKLARQGVRITELPIAYHGRTRREGKKIRAKDFFLNVRTLLRCRF